MGSQEGIRYSAITLCAAPRRQTARTIGRLATAVCTDAVNPAAIPRTTVLLLPTPALPPLKPPPVKPSPRLCPSSTPREGCTVEPARPAQLPCTALRHPEPPRATPCQPAAQGWRSAHLVSPRNPSLPSAARRCHLAQGARYIFILGCVGGPGHLLISPTWEHCFSVKGKFLFAGRNRTILPLDQICK